MTASPLIEPQDRNEPSPRENEPLLVVENLRTGFRTPDGFVLAVNGASFEVGRGEAVALVGESGSGKSVTAMSIMRLVQRPGRIVSGSVRYDGRDLLQLSENEMRHLRGSDIAMIFQEPMTSLNPVFRIGDQLAEAIMIHKRLGKREAKQEAGRMLELVSIPDPFKRLDDYPHQLSGGMRQRVMIAMALSCDPELLIADEPTTALDVTIQAQIMEILAELQQRLGLSILLITHDLGVVAEFCKRVVVMYTGRVVEDSSVDDLFASPKHPYTQGLLGSLPSLDEDAHNRPERLTTIPGMVPGIGNLPSGCKFHPRCPEVMDICSGLEPALYQLENDREVRCYLYGDAPDPELNK